MIFEPASLKNFSAYYPASPARLRHQLQGHNLCAVERLIELARALPASSVEYNSGDIPINQDPAKTPMNGLSAEETVRRIAENKSWIVLKNIEQDKAYKALLDECLADIAAAATTATGVMHKREGFIFVSSPGSVTPFHMDPEHNILMQIQGAKSFTIFPADADDIVSAVQHEAFHRPGGHRNLSYREEYANRADRIELSPGDAFYVPVKSPHWVKVGPQVSISLSVTWRSALSDREAYLHRANGWLREKGMTPPRPGAAPLRDHAVVFSAKAAARLRGA